MRIFPTDMCKFARVITKEHCEAPSNDVVGEAPSPKHHEIGDHHARTHAKLRNSRGSLWLVSQNLSIGWTASVPIDEHQPALTHQQRLQQTTSHHSKVQVFSHRSIVWCRRVKANQATEQPSKQATQITWFRTPTRRRPTNQFNKTIAQVSFVANAKWQKMWQHQKLISSLSRDALKLRPSQAPGGLKPLVGSSPWWVVWVVVPRCCGVQAMLSCHSHVFTFAQTC